VELHSPVWPTSARWRSSALFLASFVGRPTSISDVHMLAKHCAYKDRHLVGCNATDVLQEFLSLEVEILRSSEMSVELSPLWEPTVHPYESCSRNGCSTFRSPTAYQGHPAHAVLCRKWELLKDSGQKGHIIPFRNTVLLRKGLCPFQAG
jgi:hypothetical protein